MQAPPGGGSPRLTTAKEWSLSSAVECTTNQAPLAELVAEADETLSKNILHILHQQQLMKHGRNAINPQPSLKKTWLFTYCKTFSNCYEFITRVLYKDMY